MTLSKGELRAFKLLSDLKWHSSYELNEAVGWDFRKYISDLLRKRGFNIVKDTLDGTNKRLYQLINIPLRYKEFLKEDIDFVCDFEKPIKRSVTTLF